MYDLRDFFDELTVMKPTSLPAVKPDGARTIHGFFHPDDASILARFYPRVGEDAIRHIAGFIDQPRLAEVAGLADGVERYRAGAFTEIDGLSVNMACNPFMILFWSTEHDTVCRLRAPEIELRHKWMEKLALRHRSLRAINGYLERTFGVTTTFFHSCGAATTASGDLEAVYASSYYRGREALGCRFDTDILAVQGLVFDCTSVADVPRKILDASVDFGPPEVKSYLRFMNSVETAVRENAVTHDPNNMLYQARTFLLGTTNPVRAAA